MFIGVRQESLLAFFSFLWLRRSFLLVRCRIELGGDHDDAVVLHAVSVSPFFGFEVTLYGEQSAFGDLVEGFGVGVFLSNSYYRATNPCFQACHIVI